MTESLRTQLAAARAAQAALQTLTTEQITALLLSISTTLVEHIDDILAQNIIDVAALAQHDPNADRLRLTAERIQGIAAGLRTISQLPDPVGRTLDERVRPNGLILTKVTVPLGTVAAIYEARPNVTVDIAGLCLKSRNVVILKGGREADRTNRLLIRLMHDVFDQQGLPRALVTLLPADRSIALELVEARGFVDLLIARGSQSLIDWTREHAHVPFIETGAGVCHTYIDAAADVAMAAAIVTNAKTRRPSVCNALDTLIVHEDQVDNIPTIVLGLHEAKVEIWADAASHAALVMDYPAELLFRATDQDFGTEFLSLKLAIKTVVSIDEALAHIAEHGSKHSEAIITGSQQNADRFLQGVDAAAVYHNASISFTDGAEFGMGAELGISTQKLHARGPMALAELTSYKWLIRGSGQARTA